MQCCLKGEQHMRMEQNCTVSINNSTDSVMLRISDGMGQLEAHDRVSTWPTLTFAAQLCSHVCTGNLPPPCYFPLICLFPSTDISQTSIHTGGAAALHISPRDVIILTNIRYYTIQMNLSNSDEVKIPFIRVCIIFPISLFIENQCFLNTENFCLF